MSDCGGYSSLSTCFSTLSLVSWVFAQLPQIYANYTSKSAEGIAPLFLLLWFLGDFLSFTSCLLNTVVLKFQLYLSLFFICNDIMLCFQYYYYNSVYPRKYAPIRTADYRSDPGSGRFDSRISNEQPIVDSDVVKGDSTASITTQNLHFRNPEAHDTFSGLSSTPQDTLSSSSPDGSYSSINENNGSYFKKGILYSILNAGTTQALPVIEKTEPSDAVSMLSGSESLGLLLAWACTCVYMGSRCPQLYKNYKRKSVDGISPLLFGSALSGNVFYTLSILASCEFIENDTKMDFFMKELPYMLGSLGTVVFDIAYFYQRHIYRETGVNTSTMNLDSWDIADQDD